ncbi:MAG: hypothetical protein KC609_20895 [Myxococcales bacterium]|nr:hypothetical protein [Myxococcales bacterium]
MRINPGVVLCTFFGLLCLVGAFLLTDEPRLAYELVVSAPDVAGGGAFHYGDHVRVEGRLSAMNPLIPDTELVAGCVEREERVEGRQRVRTRRYSPKLALTVGDSGTRRVLVQLVRPCESGCPLYRSKRDGRRQRGYRQGDRLALYGKVAALHPQLYVVATAHCRGDLDALTLAAMREPFDVPSGESVAFIYFHAVAFLLLALVFARQEGRSHARRLRRQAKEGAAVVDAKREESS